MYTVQNFKTKKALKEALKAGDEVSFFQPNQMFPMKVLNPDYTGKIALEGPHYPQPHSCMRRAVWSMENWFPCPKCTYMVV